MAAGFSFQFLVGYILEEVDMDKVLRIELEVQVAENVVLEVQVAENAVVEVLALLVEDKGIDHSLIVPESDLVVLRFGVLVVA